MGSGKVLGREGRRGRGGYRVVLGLLMLAYLARRAWAADLDRAPGESVQGYAERHLPAGNELASKPVDLELEPLGRVIVILFTPATEEANYTGWIMVPQGSDGRAYRKEVLPPLAEASGLFDIEVKSIFSADVDGDASPELCVLARFYRNGSGEKAYPATDCFRWTGKKFELVDAVGPLSVGLKNAKAVRSYFAKHPIKPGTRLPR